MNHRRSNENNLEKWETPHIINENILPPHSSFQEEEQISLNGTWDFFCAASLEEREEDFWKVDFNAGKWPTITVPGCWEPQGYGIPYYMAQGFPEALHTEAGMIPKVEHNMNRIGQYRHAFILAEGWNNEDVLLRFGSVKSAFYCWLNGRYVGFAKGSMLPTEFDVTDMIKPGDNLICVEAYQFSDASYLENQDMWILSGIHRDVSLIKETRNRIIDVHAHATLSENYQSAHLQVDVTTTAVGGNDRLRMKLWDGDILRASQETILKKNGIKEERHFSGKILCDDIETWSAEKPKLYHLQVELIAGENVSSSKTIEFGFREIVIRGEELLINGMPLKLRGVNYHAFTPEAGYYVPKEVYERDLITMKQNNINAIRTSHYPQDGYFYHLCNTLGIYVMDECNVESHGVREKNVPGDDPLWTRHVIDRMERMVVRDRNHPCVVIWSLGNESGIGKNHYRMRERTLELDETRPIHYEGGSDLNVSDFVCEGYSSVGREQQFANGEDIPKRVGVTETVDPNLVMSLDVITYDTYKNHPLIATEYMHSMGNSGSDIGKHMEVYEHSRRWCGGFIWDFKDKVLMKNRKDNQLVYFRDSETGGGSHPIVFGCDGLTNAMGTPHEQLSEVKHGYQILEMRFRGKDTEGNILVEVTNWNSFLNINEYEFHYEFSRDGELVTEGLLETDIRPRETETVTIPHLDSSWSQIEGEYFLTLSLQLKEDTLWASKGFELAYDQWEIPDNQKLKTSMEEITFKQVNGNFIAESNDIIYNIDAKSGNLSELKSNNQNFLKTPLRPAFSRARTDADLGFMGLAMGQEREKDQYAKITLGEEHLRAEIRIEKAGGLEVINELWQGENKLGTLYRCYKVYADGSLEVSAHFVADNQAPVRFGMQAEIDSLYHRMCWLGRGPHDTYWGRDKSGKIGIYEKEVSDQDEHIRPQEHGNKRGIRWVKFLDQNGKGLKFETLEDPISASSWPYSLQQLWDCNHISKLPEYELTTINIDCIQNGLGDAFVKVPSEYVMKPGENYHYRFKVSVEM